MRVTPRAPTAMKAGAVRGAEDKRNPRHAFDFVAD
jgi:hypothetical protein